MEMIIHVLIFTWRPQRYENMLIYISNAKNNLQNYTYKQSLLVNHGEKMIWKNTGLKQDKCFRHTLKTLRGFSLQQASENETAQSIVTHKISQF